MNIVIIWINPLSNNPIHHVIKISISLLLKRVVDFASTGLTNAYETINSANSSIVTVSSPRRIPSLDEEENVSLFSEISIKPRLTNALSILNS